MANEIPVFLVLGFLDSGKTAFIKDTLMQDYFNDGSENLLVVCEEGEEEYDEKFLKKSKTTVSYLTDEGVFTSGKLRELEKDIKPDRIFIEYNGMWPLSLLSEVLEGANWPLAQVITIANAENFDLYLNNMRSLIVENLKISDVTIFNRCSNETPRAAYRRLARAANPRAQVAFEAKDGIELNEEEALPYNLQQDPIDIDDADYAVFHMDAMENNERYQNKKIHFKAQFCKPRWGANKGSFIPGRFAMVCCANDIQFIGYIAQCDPLMLKGLAEREWIEVVATVKYEKRHEYNGVGPVLYAETVEPCEKPAEDVVYF